MHPKEIFLSNIKENNKIVYYEDFGYGTVRGERERESQCVQLPVEEQMQHMPWV